MSYHLKLLKWPETGNHLIAITRGAMAVGAFKDLFAEVMNVTQPLADCKVLIDFEEATYNLEAADIEILVDEFRPELWPENVKIAMVAGPAKTRYEELLMLSTHLTKLGVSISVFFDTNVAINWLADDR